MSEYLPWTENDEYYGLLGTNRRDWYIATSDLNDSWDEENPEAAFWANSGDDVIESYLQYNWLYGERGDDTITTHNQEGLNVVVGGLGKDKITVRGKESYITTSAPINPMTIKYNPSSNERDKITIDLNGANKNTRHYVFDFKFGLDWLTIKGQDLKTDLVNIQYGLSKLDFKTAILSFKNGAKVLLNFAEQQVEKFSNFMGEVKEAVTYNFTKWESKVADLRDYASKMGTLMSQAAPTKLSIRDDSGDKHSFKLISSPKFEGINLMGK